MHDSAPGSHVFTATQVTHLIGGRLDGINVPLPEHCSEFYAHPKPTVQQLEDHYRYCPHASARLNKPCFIHSSLAHDLYAR